MIFNSPHIFFCWLHQFFQLNENRIFSVQTNFFINCLASFFWAIKLKHQPILPYNDLFLLFVCVYVYVFMFSTALITIVDSFSKHFSNTHTHSNLIILALIFVYLLHAHAQIVIFFFLHWNFIVAVENLVAYLLFERVKWHVFATYYQMSTQIAILWLVFHSFMCFILHYALTLCLACYVYVKDNCFVHALRCRNPVFHFFSSLFVELRDWMRDHAIHKSA